MVDVYFREDNNKSKIVVNRKVPWISITSGLVIALVVIFITNINVALANMELYDARQALAQGKVKESVVEFENIKKWHSPHQWDINWDYAMDILYILPRVYSSDKELARQIYDVGVESMKEVVELRPMDVRARLAYMDLMRSGGMVLFEIEGAKEAVAENLRISKELSPNRQQIEYAEITFIAGNGDIDKAVEMANELIIRDPEIADGYYTLAQLYRLKNDHYKIIEVLDKAINTGVIFYYSEHQILAAEEYELLGRFRDALYWYDQAYKTTGNERIKYKRDELSGMTQKPVPQSLEEFFPFVDSVGELPVELVGEEGEVNINF